MGSPIVIVLFFVVLPGILPISGRFVQAKVDESVVEGSTCPRVIPRASWKAEKPKGVESLNVNPPPYVVVHHSATKGCNDRSSCATLVKSIQTDHMVHKKWQDIGCNFLIGGDGSIFEGRGWGVTGAHAIGYNSRSIGICLLGNFMNEEPSPLQRKALKKLIRCGVSSRKIHVDYHLVGHRQVGATLCPGDHLYQIIQKWGHFSEHPTKQQVL